MCRCPRCDASEITFEVLSAVSIQNASHGSSQYELSCKCRRCQRLSIFAVVQQNNRLGEVLDNPNAIVSYQSGLNSAFEVLGHLSLRDEATIEPPSYMPERVTNAFREGATCLKVQCFNASGAMFRLAVDLATKDLLPEGDGATGGPNRQQRNNLHDRISYLFDTSRLPIDLRDLAACIKDDGNDGAHDGTLTKADAEDLLDFATELFRRMFTEPERIRLAKDRRDQRR